jgi:UDP:flavonoid glycosyltransferase YjiC (YdhE family)
MLPSESFKKTLVCLFSLAALCSFDVNATTLADDHFTPKHVCFFAGVGSPSHIKPLILYGEALKEKGHRVSFAAGEDFAHVLNPAEFDNSFTVLKERTMSPASTAMLRTVPYTMLSLAKLTELFLNPYDIALYTNFSAALESLREQNDLPDVIVCDFFGYPCFDVAKAFNIPAIAAAHVPHPVGETFLITPFNPNTISHISN